MNSYRVVWMMIWRAIKVSFHPLFILLASLILWVEHSASQSSFLSHLWQVAFLMALSIWAQVLWMFLLRPFWLDKQLANTGFLKLVRVAAVVIAVPVLITGVIMWCQQDESRVGHAVYSHDLIYEENLYGAGECDSQSDSLATEDPVSLSYLKSHHSRTAAQEPPSLFWSVIYHFTDPGNQHMTTSANGRGWAFLIAVLGVIFMGGFLITTLVNWIEQRTRKFEEGLQRYGGVQFWNQSVVLFIGAHPILQYTISNILKDAKRAQGIDYFVILTSAKIDELRNQLCSAFPEEVTERIIIYSGSTTDPEQLKSLPYRSVREIYLLGEHDGNLHDEHNIETMNFLSDQLQWPFGSSIWVENAKKTAVQCHVLFEFQSTFSVFQSSDSASVKNNIEFIPYNYYELWAQQVIMGNQVNGIEYPPIEGKGGLRANDDRYLHLFVVGMSNMGIALASEVATMAHFPNFKQYVSKESHAMNPNNRTRITILDKNMSEEMQFFMSRHKVMFQLSRWRFVNMGVTKESCEALSDLNYFSSWGKQSETEDSLQQPWQNSIENKGTPFHHLLKREDGSVEPNFVDVEWQFMQGGIEDAAVQNYLRAEATNKRVRLVVAICLPDDVQSAAAALYLPEEVLLQPDQKQEEQQKEKQGQETPCVPVLVYQKGGKDLLRRFAGKDFEVKPSYKHLLPFGMLGDCTIQYPQLEFAQYLACAYDIHKEITEQGASVSGKNVYELMKTFIEKVEKNPNFAEDKWKDANMWKRWSNIYNAMHMLFKLRSMGLSLESNEKTLKKELGVDTICFTLVEGNLRYTIDRQASYYKLAKVEHNRWNIEKLFMGYRPPFESEMKDKKKKDMLKRQFVHLNLCSFDKLQEIDPNVIDFDVAFIVAIPIIKTLMDQKHKA